MKPMVVTIPLFFDKKKSLSRQKYWRQFESYVTGVSDCIVLVMGNDEDAEFVKRCSPNSIVIHTNVKFHSYHARMILSFIVKDMGYKIEYINDDDECLSNKVSVDLPGALYELYKLGNVYDIEKRLESECIGIRYREPRSTTAPHLEYCPSSDEAGNKVVSRYTEPADKLYSVRTFGKNKTEMIVPTNPSTSRMQRGFIFKSGDVYSVLEGAYEYLHKLESYTPAFPQFDDTLFPYILHHVFNKKFYCVWNEKDSDIWMGTLNGGTSESVINNNPESMNTQFNLNLNNKEELEELAYDHQELTMFLKDRLPHYTLSRTAPCQYLNLSIV